MINSSGNDGKIGRRADNNAAAGQALADIVVAFAFELEGNAAREPRAEALARGAGEPHMDGAVGQAGMAVALGDFTGEHGAGGAVGVVDHGLQAHRRAAVEGGLQSAISLRSRMSLIL